LAAVLWLVIFRQINVVVIPGRREALNPESSDGFHVSGFRVRTCGAPRNDH
jgi:hypothetical protein